MSDDIVGVKPPPPPWRYTAHGSHGFVVYQPNDFGFGPVKEEYHHTRCPHPKVLRWHTGSHPVAWLDVNRGSREVTERQAQVIAAAPQMRAFVKQVFDAPYDVAQNGHRAYELLNLIPFGEVA